LLQSLLRQVRLWLEQSVQVCPPWPQALWSNPVRHVLPSQQPLPQVDGVQRQVACVHSEPALHATPLPHMHCPPEHPFANDELQTVQAPPLVPQLAAWFPGMQTLPAQQPEQVVLLHTQEVPLQACPVTQAGPVPHPQVPLIRHALVREEAVQSTQVPPAEPQLVFEAGLTQVDVTVPAWQQPRGHEVLSQMQAPPTQRCPAAHSALPEPQRQLPASQRSERLVSQAEHTPPPVPHCACEGATHVEPLQQPEGQSPALQPWHACAWQVCAPQEAQVAPPWPHTVFEVPAWQR
jgi:hypothetical protein